MIDIRKYEVVNTYRYASNFDSKSYTNTSTNNMESHENFKVGMNWAKSTISPDGNYIASGSSDGTVYIWNTRSTMVDSTLKEHR